MTEIKRVIALGFFDGVHIGHAALLNKTKERAAALGAMPSVLSFDVHPDTLVFHKEVPLINSAIGREDIIRREFGIDNVVFLHFSEHTMRIPWRQFIESIVQELAICHIVVGHDFCFGYRGEGTVERLQEYCAETGIGCDVIPPVMLDGQIVSSTRIRAMIEAGDMEQARRWLGHPHTLADTVHSGYHLGRKLGTPTINMFFPDGVLVPRHGVYAARVFLEDGKSYVAVTNIGSGSGYYLTNGQCADIVWSRSSGTDIMHYSYPGGDPLILNAGKTFICIVEKSAENSLSFNYKW